MIDFKPLLEKLASLPTLTSTTPGPTCPKCGSMFIVTYGRRSKAWLILHSGIGPAALCEGYQEHHPLQPSQEAALALAQSLGGKDEAPRNENSLVGLVAPGNDLFSLGS